MGSSNLGQGMDFNQMSQMMQNPSIQRMMNRMMQNPQIMQQVSPITYIHLVR
jgi:hypothetical protein